MGVLGTFGCRGAFEDRELKNERKTLIHVELTTTSIDFDAVTSGQHYGACHVSGKSIGFLPYDQWTYFLEVQPKGELRVVGLVPTQLDGSENGTPDGKNPFDDAKLIDHCESAKSDRMAFRAVKSSRDAFTVVLPFAHSVLMLNRQGDGKTCADVLAAQAPPRDWLHTSLTKRDDDLLFAIQVANLEKVEREAVADAALSVVFEANELTTLVEEVQVSAKLRDHILARLAPEAAPAGTPGIATMPSEAGIEALLAAIPEEKIEAAFLPDIAACKDVSKNPECTWLRLYAYAHWAAAMEKRPSCDALAEIAIALATADPTHLDIPISLRVRLDDCPDPRLVKELQRVTPEPGQKAE